MKLGSNMGTGFQFCFMEYISSNEGKQGRTLSNAAHMHLDDD